MIVLPNFDSVYYFDRMREAVPVTEVGSQCRLTFKMPGIKSTDLKASVTSPTGKVCKMFFEQYNRIILRRKKNL